MTDISIKAFSERIKKAVTSALEKSNMKELAKSAAEKIRVRTGLGYGVKLPGGKRGKLKALSSKPYIKRRAALKGKGKLSSKTSKGKSNLTATGQMLEGIEGKSVKAGQGVIYFREFRKDGKTNSEIAGYAEEGGREFFTLSDREIKALSDEVRKNFLKSFEKQFKK